MKMRWAKTTLFTLLLASTIGIGVGNGVTSAQAETRFASEYAISAIGFRVGNSKFDTTIDANGTYSIDGSLRSSGVARLFAAINGTLTAKGGRNNAAVYSTAFDVAYTEGKKSKSTRFATASGQITGATNVPEIKPKGEWVPLKPSDLRDAVDPIASIMVPASGRGEVCARSLKAFDGVMRMDVKLKYLRTVPFSTKGFKGDAVTCRGRFVPVSGYDAKKRDVTWMRDNGVIDVSFAPVGTTGYYAPVKARIKTRAVTLNIHALRFEQLTN